MSEPEDLILEGAHYATRIARRAWTRYGPPRTARAVPLASVRARLELFLTALFEQPIAIAAAEPPPPPTWLWRLEQWSARLGQGGGGGEVRVKADATRLFPATDGIRVYLPASLDVSVDDEHTIDLYRLLAVEQAARLVRGVPKMLATIQSRQTRDQQMVTESVAIDRWIATELPGLLPTLEVMRAQAVAERPAGRAVDPLEAFVRRALREPLTATAPDEPVPAGSGHPIAPVWFWGRTVDASPSAAAKSGESVSDHQEQASSRPRVAEMRRRPRIREAAEDEDDTRPGAWVIRADEPQESVEDPFGLQRPADQEEHADAEGLADSLSDLPEARLVRTPGRPREVLRAGEDLPRTAASPAARPAARGTAYPEWDYREGQYRVPGAIVREPAAAPGDEGWVSAALARHGRLARRVRSRFERLRPRRVWVGRQPDGSDVDIDAFVTSAADIRAGSSVDGRLYVSRRQARRELAVALLVDVSASTDSWVSEQRRIVDVEKEALVIVCEALDALGDPYAIYAFSGEGPGEVSVRALKRLGERSSVMVRRRIAALDSDRYTRMGAAIRHVTQPLCRQASERRLLLVLSDGKPNDIDAYEGRYGIEDTRQAVAEARRQGVSVFCLTIDREAPRYAARIFGKTGFAVLNRPAQLPVVLIDALRHLVSS